MLLALFVAIFIVIKCHAQLFLVNDIPEEHKTECKNDKCAVVCRPTHCNNEYIKLYEDNREVDVYCESPYSCMGQVKINGEVRWGKVPAVELIRAPAVERGQTARLYCNREEEPNNSCRGADFAFYKVYRARLEGNFRESTITFKDVTQALITVTAAEHFQLNTIWTENVGALTLSVNAVNAAIGNVFDLRFVDYLVKIVCLRKGACAGSIFMFDSSSDTKVTIYCAENACAEMSIWITEGDKKKERPEFTISFIKPVIKPVIKRKTRIVRRESPPRDPRPLSAVSGVSEVEKSIIWAFADSSVRIHGQRRNPFVEVHEFDDIEGFLGAMNRHFAELQIKYNKLLEASHGELKSGEKCKLPKWIIATEQKSYLGAVFAEGAIGTMLNSPAMVAAKAVAKGVKGKTIAKGISAAIVGSVTATFSWPLLITGVVAVSAYAYMEYRKSVKKSRFVAKAAAAAGKSAKQEIENIFGEYMAADNVENVATSLATFDSDGSIIDYDFFTWERMDELNELNGGISSPVYYVEQPIANKQSLSSINMQNDDMNYQNDMMDYIDVMSPSDRNFGINIVAFILGVIITVMVCFCTNVLSAIIGYGFAVFNLERKQKEKNTEYDESEV